ncbi:MAG: hypothetical protein FWD59_06655 [Micrococcales bacterium]|nr:hypothetical protein [Micrococcales bacterium]
MGIPRFATRLDQVAVSYLPIIGVDPTGRDEMMVKWELLTGRVSKGWSREPKASERLGLEPMVLSFQIDGEMEANREHLRIHLPTELQVAAAPIAVIDEPGGDDDSRDDRQSQWMTAAWSRSTRDRAIVYRVKSDEPIDYDVVLAVRPKLDGFAAPALFGLCLGIAVFAMLLLGYFVDGLPWVRSVKDGSALSAAMSILVLGATTISGVSVVRDRDPARLRVLPLLRRFVLGASCLSLLVGLMTVIYMRVIRFGILAVLWAVALAGLLAAAAWLAACWLRTASDARRIDRIEDRTVRLQALREDLFWL